MMACDGAIVSPWVIPGPGASLESGISQRLFCADAARHEAMRSSAGALFSRGQRQQNPSRHDRLRSFGGANPYPLLSLFKRRTAVCRSDRTGARGPLAALAFSAGRADAFARAGWFGRFSKELFRVG